MDAINIEQAIKLAEIRAKSVKEYDKIMTNLFTVYADFIIFENEFEKVLTQYEKSAEENKKWVKKF